MLVTTYCGGAKIRFFSIRVVTVDGVLHNMDVLDIKGNELHAVVLSLGHTITPAACWVHQALRPAESPHRAPSRRLFEAQKYPGRRP